MLRLCHRNLQHLAGIQESYGVDTHQWYMRPVHILLVHLIVRPDVVQGN